MKKNLIGLLTIIILWLLITFIFNPPSYLFPSLINTVTDFISNYQLYIHHTCITVIEIVLGFIVALFIGLSLSLVALYYQKTETIFTFISIILKTIPIIAIAPLLVLWFGNGLGSKVAAVAITSFIPIFVNTLSGAKTILNRYKNIIGIYSLNKLEINKMKYQDVINYLIENEYVKKNDSYDYLTDIPIRYQTKEYHQKLIDLFNLKKDELLKLKKTPIEQIWMNEIGVLLNYLLKQDEKKKKVFTVM